MDLARSELAKADTKIKRLEIEVEHQRLLILELRRSRYGAKGEKLSSLQLNLFDLEPGVGAQEVEAVAGQADPVVRAEEGEAGADSASPAKRRYHQPQPGRGELPAHLPRVERVLECTAEECRCGQCGNDKQLIGWDVSETLDLKPLEFFWCKPNAPSMRAPSVLRRESRNRRSRRASLSAESAKIG